MTARVLAVAALTIAAAFGDVAKPDPSPDEVQKIINTFAANEAAFAKARENYTYRQTATIREADEAGTPGGKFERVDEIDFTKEGRRVERAVRAPVPTLHMVQLTAEDEEDMRNVMPFVLTSAEIDNYHVRYLGRQAVDEITTYVFAVKPKTMAPGKRYFQGQIWVDDRDLQIVKTYGRAIGAQKKGFEQQFPKFETYRQQIDGKYWFPVYTRADSLLHFAENKVRLRQTIKYDDYKQYKAETTITFGDEVTDPAKPVAPAK